MNCGQFDVKVFIEKFGISEIINANIYLKYVKNTTLMIVFITLIHVFAIVCFYHTLHHHRQRKLKDTQNQIGE